MWSKPSKYLFHNWIKIRLYEKICKGNGSQSAYRFLYLKKCSDKKDVVFKFFLFLIESLQYGTSPYTIDEAIECVHGAFDKLKITFL